MNTDERKTIDELFELCDKYAEQGDVKRARECLREARKINSKIWEQVKRETIEILGEDLFADDGEK